MKDSGVKAVVLDIDHDRIEAMGADSQGRLVPIALQDEASELPLCVALDRRRPIAGRQALTLAYQAPLAVCRGFLPLLGTTARWEYQRHTVCAEDALEIVLRQVAARLPRASAVVFVVPSYLSVDQMRRVVRIASLAGIDASALATRPLIVALAGIEGNGSQNIVVDADDWALSFVVVRAQADEIRQTMRAVDRWLGRRIWKEAVIRYVAEWCIRISRRDPRDSPLAYGMLQAQAESLLDAACENKRVFLELQSELWLQALDLSGGDIARACHYLAGMVVQDVRRLERRDARLTDAAVLLSPTAAQLPALASAVYACGEDRPPPTVPAPVRLLGAALAVVTRAQHGASRRVFYTRSVPLCHLPLGEGLA
ncbi:MAG: hypothetical protein C4297_06325 [Gemmataceae bacterium]